MQARLEDSNRRVCFAGKAANEPRRQLGWLSLSFAEKLPQACADGTIGGAFGLGVMNL